jgi:signal transduction histidine kinase
MRLLVVDADTRTLAALADVVGRRLAGTTLDTARSAESALQMLAACAYDAVVCSTGLPDMDHVTVLTAIREHQPLTPILVLCAQLHEDLLVRAALLGVFHFVPKPIQPDAFVATVSHLLEHRRLQREAGRLQARSERSARRARRAIALSRLQLESRETLLQHRQDALDQCRAAEAGLIRTLDGVPAAIMLCDPSWRITLLNRVAVRRLAAPPESEEPVGRPLWEAFPGPAGSTVEEACRKASQERCDVRMTITIGGMARDLTIMPFDGGQAVYMRDPEAAAPDRTAEHERSRSSRRGAASEAGPWRGSTERPESARTVERNRMARDLQEDLREGFAALTTDLSWLESRLASDQLHLVLKVQLMVQIVKRMGDGLRRICSEVRPAILEDLGLAAAIRWHATTFEHRTGIRCLVTIKDGGRIDPNLATGMFRVFQELLHNVGRHAGASLLCIGLTRDNGDLVLEVKDDGKGIEPGPLNDPSSQGLRRMEERARLLGGHFSIAGVPGEGTIAALRVPVDVP